MSDQKSKGRTAILVADDDADVRLALEMSLSYEGFEIWTAKDGEEAWKRLQKGIADDKPAALVLSDLKMPRLDGMGLLEKISSLDNPPQVVVISGHGDVEVAVAAMQHGAANFLEKPLDENRLRATIRATLRQGELTQENRELRNKLVQNWELVGQSESIERLRRQLGQVAASEATVLITGENGVGKEVVARNLHAQSARAAAPFIAVNCAAIPSELIESQLFGHEKGSFTGASERHIGHFEAADGGTLFLDEIGDMPAEAQSKVLRSLESHEVVRVGTSSGRKVDIRVIAATNADLAAAVEEGSFRMDLFYRLNVVPLRVPALRERTEDIPLLAAHFLAKSAERTGLPCLTLDPETQLLLAQQDFPGNVRQLRNLMEGAAIFSDGTTIQPADLESVLSNGPGLVTPRQPSANKGHDPFDAATFEEFKIQAETLFIRLRLERNDGNIKRTAEELGMQRSHLYKKLDRYGLR
ncbi:MAG: Fis family transcriptional regulator [Planctomycetes bacterium]|jgi:DNA-binding NtrC family response regulator|nr:Fis family transcriptional regulator [Planctomycetota bacterium]